MEAVKLETVKVRALWNQKWWRHPVVWWKTRHVRRFIRRESKSSSPLVQEVEQRLEREFLFGEEARWKR